MAAKDLAAVKAIAWRLRQRGRTLGAIAKELAVDESTVSRWLADLNRAALKRLTGDVAHAKAFQDGVLGYVLEETLDAWDRSKQPRMRVREIKAPDEVDQRDPTRTVIRPGEKITEVVQQTGDPAYIDRALAILAAQRKLWGLDVAERPNDAGPDSFAERLAAIKARVARFEQQAQQSRETPPDAPKAEDGGPVA